MGGEDVKLHSKRVEKIPLKYCSAITAAVSTPSISAMYRRR
jgi:hypothetical protein